jgi:hypothetical protein
MNSQAYDEGSIPFTRSNKINYLGHIPRHRAHFLARFVTLVGTKALSEADSAATINPENDHVPSLGS